MRLNNSCRFSLPVGGGAAGSSMSGIEAGSSFFLVASCRGRCRAVHMMLCQSGVLVDCSRGMGGGEGDGKLGISFHCSSLALHFSFVRRGLGGLDFHFSHRIFSRIAKEESSPFVVNFIRYADSLVLPGSVNLWCFLSYSLNGIS